MAGFDPPRFWEITPRLYVLEMEGAALKVEQKRAEVWFAAMLPRMESPPTLEEFTRGAKDRRAEVVKCIQAWDAMDRALMHGKGRSN